MTKLSIHTMVAALCGSFFLTACPGDDTTGTGTETEGESTSTGPSVTTMPPPTTTPPGTDSTTAEETTVAVDDTSSTGPDGTSSTGPDDTSSTGPDDTSSSGGSSSEGSSSSEGGSESSSTGDPPPMDGYGDCANNDPALVCLPDEVCLYAGMDAACMEQGCAAAGDCTIPATGTALPQCLDLTGDGTNECYLSCEAGETCPDGMICVLDLACVWPYIDVPPPMGICPDDDIGNTVPQTVMGDNTGLGDDWEPSCAPGGEDAMYEFTAPAAGNYTFDTIGSAGDTLLAVIQDCAGPELACNDDFGGLLTSSVTVPLAAGESVIIVVDGFGGGTGPFVLNIDN
jgi:hypothetical protein